MTSTTNLNMTLPTVGADLDNWGNELNANLAVIDAFAGTLMGSAEVTIASAATVDIGGAASTAVAISGTTPVTSLGTVANCIRFVRYTDAVPLTYNATTLILIGNANRTVASGDMSIFKSDATGNWREVIFRKGDGSGIFASIAATGNITAVGGLSGATLNASSNGLVGNRLIVGSAYSPIGSESLGVLGAAYFQGEIKQVNAPFSTTLTGTIFGPGYTINADGGSGSAIYVAGFGVQMNYSWSGIFAPSGGSAANFEVQMRTGGVQLDDGATSWRSLSSRHYKRNIQPIPGSALKRAAKIHGRLFNYRNDPKEAPLRAGVIYEDVAKPEAFPWAAAMSVSSGGGKTREKKMISLEQHVPLLIECIHELQAEIETLKTKRV